MSSALLTCPVRRDRCPFPFIDISLPQACPVSSAKHITLCFEHNLTPPPVPAVFRTQPPGFSFRRITPTAGQQYENPAYCPLPLPPGTQAIIVRTAPSVSKSRQPSFIKYLSADVGKLRVSAVTRRRNTAQLIGVGPWLKGLESKKCVSL